MAKRFDYYAGYPGQQRTPKWVGVTLGSLFGALTIVMLAVGIRIAMPPRKAEASVAPKPEPTTPVLVAAAAPAQPTVTADKPASELGVARYAGHGKHRHDKKMKKGKVALFAAKPAKAVPDARYKKAQVYAKSVSSNHRDKRARDELDKMLGL